MAAPNSVNQQALNSLAGFWLRPINECDNTTFKILKRSLEGFKDVRNLGEVLSAALSLSPGARAILADYLLESLGAENQKRIDAIWAEEAERRMQEICDGKVQPIDGELVMKDLRARRR